MAPRIFGNVVRADGAAIRVTAEAAMAHMQDKAKRDALAVDATGKRKAKPEKDE